MNELLMPLPLPLGLDSLRFEIEPTGHPSDRRERVTLRRGDLAITDVYVLDDCFSTRRIVTSIFPFRTKTIRFIDHEKVEAKRRLIVEVLASRLG